MSTLHFDRLHSAIWELHKRNLQSPGARELKDSWQTYVADKRAYLSKIPGTWDGLLNKYWNWYAREYLYPRNPDKPPAPLTPADVRPPGSFLERKTADLLVPVKAAGRDFTADAEQRLRVLSQEAEERARVLVQEAGESYTGFWILGAVLVGGFWLLRSETRKAFGPKS